MLKALDVVGRLTVEMGGEGSTRVEARGDSIVVDLPSLRAGLATLKRWPGKKGPALRRIHEALESAGLALTVRAGGTTIGRLGVGARPGLASRLLGFGPMEIVYRGLVPRRKQAPPSTED